MLRLLPRALLLAGLIAIAPIAARPSMAAGDEPGDEGFVPMFHGKSFDGWKKVGGGATYQFDGDTIVGKVGPGSNTFLRTEKTYGDFILKLDLKLDIPGNSGIQFRSHQQPSDDGNGRVFGYQCEVDPTSHAVDPTSRAWSAGIYDEARRGWLYPLTGHPEAQRAFKVDGWNQYTIMACGPHIRTWLNGVPCADLIDTMDLEGFIALQVHSGKAGQIRWKDVRIKDLGRSAWKPLWDGKTLVGMGHDRRRQLGDRRQRDPRHIHQRRTAARPADQRQDLRQFRRPPQVQGQEGEQRPLLPLRGRGQRRRPRPPGRDRRHARRPRRPLRDRRPGLDRPALEAEFGALEGRHQEKGKQEGRCQGKRHRGRVLERTRRRRPGRPDRRPAQRADDRRDPRREGQEIGPHRPATPRRTGYGRRIQGRRDPADR